MEKLKEFDNQAWNYKGHQSFEKLFFFWLQKKL